MHQCGPDFWVWVPDRVGGLITGKPGRLDGGSGQRQGAVTEAKTLHSGPRSKTQVKWMSWPWTLDSTTEEAATSPSGSGETLLVRCSQPPYWGGAAPLPGPSACRLCADRAPATMPRWHPTTRDLSLSQTPWKVLLLIPCFTGGTWVPQRWNDMSEGTRFWVEMGLEPLLLSLA